MAWTAYRTWVGGELVDQTMMNSQIRDNGNILKTSFDDTGNFAPAAASALTLTNNATGAITPTQTRHTVDTFAAAASGNMRTITIAGSIRDGHMLVLQAASIARVVTLNSALDNVTLQSGDMVFSQLARILVVQLFGTTWYEICRSNAAVFLPNDPVLASGMRF